MLDGAHELARACPRRAWRLLCDEGPYLNGTDLVAFTDQTGSYRLTGLPTGATVLYRAPGSLLVRLANAPRGR